MNEITDIRTRIEDALDRIGKGIAALQPVPATPPEAIDPAVLAALQDQVAEEKTANAQLEERIRLLKSRQESQIAALEAQIAAQRDQLTDLDRDLQRLRESNADLRDLAGQMRVKLADNVAEPELVNRAMMAEIEALRATRAADLAEVTAVLNVLKPVIEEAR
jgi:chromosome segregation ATPase